MVRILDQAAVKRRSELYTPVLEPGDVIFTASGGLLSMIIRHITEGSFSHAIICAGAGVGFQATDHQVGVRATRGGIEAVDLGEVLLNRRITAIDVLRPREPVTAPQVWAAVEDLLRNDGDDPPGFSMAGLFWLAALYVVSEPPNGWLRRGLAHVSARLLADGTSGVTCSELVTRVLERSGVNLGFGDADIGSFVEEYPAPRDLERSGRLSSLAPAGPYSLASARDLIARYYGPAQPASGGWLRRRTKVRTVQIGRGTLHQLLIGADSRTSDRSDFVSPAWLYRSRAFSRWDPEGGRWVR